MVGVGVAVGVGVGVAVAVAVVEAGQVKTSALVLTIQQATATGC